MGGRGSSGGTRIKVPDGKRPRGGRKKKLKGEAGNPYGTERPGQPAGGTQGKEGQ
jgi:hypothetical protein